MDPETEKRLMEYLGGILRDDQIGEVTAILHWGEAVGEVALDGGRRRGRDNRMGFEQRFPHAQRQRSF